MRRLFDAYFGFTRSEFNGLLMLILLIAFIMAFPSFYKLFKPAETLSPEDSKAIEQLSIIENTNSNMVFSKPEQGTITTKPGIQLFPFDPNTIDRFGWEKLGLSAKQAQAILNYRNKGGRFYKPQDLEKMYTISKERYRQLLPYIQIANIPVALEQGKKFEREQYKKPIFQVVDINKADSAGLEEIRGIGATFARRIVAYRNRLGGFYKKEQLMEVYGLDSVRYNALKDQITIEAAILKKININTATFDELKKHPYLQFKEINALIRYREIHGNFLHIGDLKKVVVLTEPTIEKLTPYLTF